MYVVLNLYPLLRFYTDVFVQQDVKSAKIV